MPLNFLQKLERGLESPEKRQLREQREAEEAREKEKFGLEKTRKAAEESRLAAEEARKSEAHEWEKIDRGYERAERGYLLAKKVYGQGDYTGAASILTHTYNKYIPDGNQVMIITPQSQPEYFQQLLQSGKVSPEYANAQAILVSKDLGTVPFRSFDELMKIVDEDFNKENYVEAKKRGDQKVADLNATSFKDIQYAASGEPYVYENYMDDSGILRQRAVLFDPEKHGPMPESKRNELLRGLGLDPYNLSDEQKRWLEDNTRIKLGLKTKEEEKRAKTQDFRETVKWGLEMGNLAKGKGKGDLTENQKANLYADYQKEYRERFIDELSGQPKEGAPDEEIWINKQINKAIGKTKKPTGTGERRLISSTPGESGNTLEIYDDGTQRIIGPDGEVIAERVSGKIEK